MTPQLVYLVSCSNTKRGGPGPHPAKDLYTGELFVKCRAFVEKTGHPWFIVSALHGLVHPDAPLHYYDRHLRALSTVQRRAWGAAVRDELERDGLAEAHFVVLAGKTYRDAMALPYSYTAPLEGLSQGRQLAAMKRAVETGELEAGRP